jgi:hypothetical protein
MKIVQIITAGAIALASLTVPVAAQARGHDNRYEHNGRGRYHDWRRDSSHRGYRSYYAGQRRDRCWTEWRHNHRVRVCR